ncbi:MAG: 4Fe-4S binding protein [Deltaproteobacteria bacterium]|nr:4Fe-4S binding protein [Deltaproteobacteria bacterium]
MIMEVLINKDKCTIPLNCRKCLEVCPQCIFQLYPTGIKKFEEIPPENWHLRASYQDLCAGCMECVKACPQNAIRVRPLKNHNKEVCTA